MTLTLTTNVPPLAPGDVTARLSLKAAGMAQLCQAWACQIRSLGLHQLYQGIVKHMVSWVTETCGSEEVDARCRHFLPNHNLQHFNKGISSLSCVTGSDVTARLCLKATGMAWLFQAWACQIRSLGLRASSVTCSPRCHNSGKQGQQLSDSSRRLGVMNLKDSRNL